MKEEQAWAIIFGPDYLYKKNQRIILKKTFITKEYDIIRRGQVFSVKEDEGKTVWIEIAYSKFEEILKSYIEPFPFKDFKVGDKVKVLVTIDCQGSCTQHQNATAYCSIRKGRIGIVEEMHDYGIFHRILLVRFRGGDRARYEDYEIRKIE